MYSLAIALYAFAVRLVAPFHKKARLMTQGQRKTFSILREKIIPDAKYIWFHAASLGEFEQGRPLIEKIRKEQPEYKILLTFFSPSGYEVKKDYDGADIVCYLPFDFFRNATRFLDLAHPEIAIFIKYEFWMNYLTQLKKRNIPTYIISAIFRPNQIFFRWYGNGYKKVLKTFKWLFVQDKNSLELLKKNNIHNVTISGDTRFDRVYEILNQNKKLPLVEKFVSQNNKDITLVAGSTWSKDEEIIISYFNQNPDLKLVIASHELGETRISEIISRLERPYALYSKATESEVENVDCLIIDCYGLLSTIYRYGQIAYIGGGFGVGIHNVLEAAVYGIPVLFGPNYKRFKEARDLILRGGAFSISTETAFNGRVNEMLAYKQLREQYGKSAKDYIEINLGATQIIYEKIF